MYTIQGLNEKSLVELKEIALRLGIENINVPKEELVYSIIDQQAVHDQLRDRGNDEIFHAGVALQQSRDQTDHALEVALQKLLTLRRSAGNESVFAEGQRTKLQAIDHNEGAGKVDILLVKRDVTVIERNRFHAALHGIIDHLLNCYL